LSIVIFSDVPFPWPLHARTAVGQEKPKPTSRPPTGAIGCASPVRQHRPGSSGRWWRGPPQRLDPAQHKLEITVADRKHQIPPDPLASPFHPAAPDGTFGKSRPQDHLGGELPAFEGPILSFLYRLSTSCHATASTRPGWRRKAATEPWMLPSNPPGGQPVRTNEMLSD
jgi:hypothetical protein